MRLIGGSNWATRLFVFGLCLAFLCASCGVGPPAAATAIRGARTSDEAARPAIADEGRPSVAVALRQPTTDFFDTSASIDTTEIDFPEDEEQKRGHLYRDIGIFLIVSAFVGYFIVKVFIQGDTDEPPPPKKGKDIPGM